MADDGCIFISHVEEDESIAAQIAEGLEKASYKAWYYERDCLPGVSHLTQERDVIRKCRAFILIISKASLNSYEVNSEVIQAHRNRKHFFPILHGVTNHEFRDSQPDWDMAIGAATSIGIPNTGVASIILPILRGLEALGIQSDTTGIPTSETKINIAEDGTIIAPRFIYQDLNGNGRWDPGEPFRWELPNPINLDEEEFIPEIPPIEDEQVKVDDETMVLIPAGEFQMGDNDFKYAPVHTVYLDAFYIDKYEVTNAQYKKFMDATGHRKPAYWDDERFNAPDHPVVGVSWGDAKAYADWAGKRLPTEAEWEKAARGGLVGKKYVWGDKWPPPDGTGNFADEAAKKVNRNWFIIDGYNDGYAYTSPVGKFKPNGYGLYDMAGNVWEWCEDRYNKDYYKNSPKENPKGPDTGVSRVLRGGSWYGVDNNLRAANRLADGPTNAYYDAGVRCAGL